MKHLFSIKKADIAVIAAILLIAVSLFLFGHSTGTPTATITVDGKNIQTIDLSEQHENRIIELENGVKIEVSENSICFIDSDCTGKDCIACGMLSSPGDIAVCIPNKTIIKLTGKTNGVPDAVSY